LLPSFLVERLLQSVGTRPDHRLAERSKVRLAELRHEDWTAAFPDGLIVRACRAAGFEPNLVRSPATSSLSAHSSSEDWP
jgi:hypothetical protein